MRGNTVFMLFLLFFLHRSDWLYLQCQRNGIEVGDEAHQDHHQNCHEDIPRRGDGVHVFAAEQDEEKLIGRFYVHGPQHHGDQRPRAAPIDADTAASTTDSAANMLRTKPRPAPIARIVPYFGSFSRSPR